MRLPPLVLVTLLVLSGAPSSPATGSPLEADAGLSQIVYDGGAAALLAHATGGAAPYTFAWSLADASTSRFSSPDSASTTLDTAGLAAGPLVVDLVVTDHDGATATDTVLLDVEKTVLITRLLTFGPSTPEERALGTSPDAKTVGFDVHAGDTRVVATLSWPNAQDDLDLEIVRPASDAPGVASRTSNDPEVATLESPLVGRWQAKAEPVVTLGTTASLTIRIFPQGSFPLAAPAPSRPFGTLDAMPLHGAAVGGTAPYSFAWDLDGDGVFESPGADVTASLPAGDHTVWLKVQDAAGYETAAPSVIHVEDAAHVARFLCIPDPTTAVAAMEFGQMGGTCWIHGGHHTYFMGDTIATLRSLQGFAFSVEQQLAPNADPLLASPNAQKSLLHVETSLDGRTWTEVASGSYQYLPTVAGGSNERQYVFFDAHGLDQSFRFLRIHEPLSLSQGLSGYLDHSQVDVGMDDAAPVPAPAVAPGSRALSCASDLMEAFFAAHPCTFGGVDRYDAASFYHTYFLGDGAKLDRVRGSFRLAPFRTDDFTSGHSPQNASATYATLYTSVDGSTWTARATINATYGVDAPIDVALPHVDARFVRLFPEVHAGFMAFEQDPTQAPLHHARGFFVTSDLVVDGDLPATG